MTLLAEPVDLGNEQFSHRQIASVLSRKLQQLIILPTEKCNFRCTYCYEDFAIGKMKEPVIAGIERFMDRRIPELTTFGINWFGGEPLMAKAIVLRLSSYASRLCKEHGVSLQGGMTTNAYILDFDLFEELLSYDQRFFQITLDGWQEGHDALRRRANGRPTFERIWENLTATRRSRENFNIMIRVHVRRDNQESLETLIDNLAAAIGGDPRYALDFEHLRDLGGEGGKSIVRPLSIAELREIEAWLRRRFEDAVARAGGGEANGAQPPVSNGAVAAVPIGELKNAQPGSSPYICYAAKPNSLLIRADGRIGKCTVALTDDRNTIGRINEDGTLALDNELLRPWIRGLGDLDADSLACPLTGLGHATSSRVAA
ncbi:MAG: uncharacterized protein QOJ94_117 [Sphingomonadales bacterium]|jgi:uncharacterized protein|nr:uncharacterized protein [Sphingomonadales bacterium]